MSGCLDPSLSLIGRSVGYILVLLVPYNRSPGLISLTYVSSFKPSGRVLGPNLSRQPAKNQENLKYIF